jgi:hypothetical protein
MSSRLSCRGGGSQALVEKPLHASTLECLSDVQVSFAVDRHVVWNVELPAPVPMVAKPTHDLQGLAEQKPHPMVGTVEASAREVVPTRPSVANRVTLQVTRGRSVCQRTGNRANSGDIEAEGWRMAVVLKSTAIWGPPSSGRRCLGRGSLPGDRPATDAPGRSRRDGAGRPADDQTGDA